MLIVTKLESIEKLYANQNLVISSGIGFIPNSTKIINLGHKQLNIINLQEKTLQVNDLQELFDTEQLSINTNSQVSLPVFDDKVVFCSRYTKTRPLLHKLAILDTKTLKIVWSYEFDLEQGNFLVPTSLVYSKDWLIVSDFKKNAYLFKKVF